MAKATAEEIRIFANTNYIQPARAAGKRQVVIRAGDIHEQMGLTSQMPQVCSAIGSNKFDKNYNIKRIGRHGPTNGANVFITYAI